MWAQRCVLVHPHTSAKLHTGCALGNSALCKEPQPRSEALKTYLQIAVVAGVVLSAIPYKTTTVPAWRIRFTDESGVPFRSLPVNQTWRNYSVEASDHRASGVTDENGYAQFPERSVWSPLVMRVLGPIGSIIGAGAHASFGSSAWIMTSCDVMERGSRLATYYGAVYYSPGSKVKADFMMWSVGMLFAGQDKSIMLFPAAPPGAHCRYNRWLSLDGDGSPTWRRGAVSPHRRAVVFGVRCELTSASRRRFRFLQAAGHQGLQRGRLLPSSFQFDRGSGPLDKWT